MTNQCSIHVSGLDTFGYPGGWTLGGGMVSHNNLKRIRSRPARGALVVVVKKISQRHVLRSHKRPR